MQNGTDYTLDWNPGSGPEYAADGWVATVRTDDGRSAVIAVSLAVDTTYGDYLVLGTYGMGHALFGRVGEAAAFHRAATPEEAVSRYLAPLAELPVDGSSLRSTFVGFTDPPAEPFVWDPAGIDDPGAKIILSGKLGSGKSYTYRRL